MKPSSNNVVTGIGLITIGAALAATGIYVGETDDAPGAALMGLILMLIAVVFGVRIARRNA